MHSQVGALCASTCLYNAHSIWHCLLAARLGCQSVHPMAVPTHAACAHMLHRMQQWLDCCACVQPQSHSNPSRLWHLSHTLLIHMTKQTAAPAAHNRRLNLHSLHTSNGGINCWLATCWSKVCYSLGCAGTARPCTADHAGAALGRSFAGASRPQGVLKLSSDQVCVGSVPVALYARLQVETHARVASSEHRASCA